MDKTTLFEIEDITNALIETTLDEIYDALKEKGYNPISQIVGYLVSGDPGYITNYKNARDKMLGLDRNKVLELMVRNYLEN
ncbi:uPF0297 protein Calow_0999 [Firmicutes bacterium CAG:582]|nr:IreB family regulatory phosphoprotein [bacterium]CDB28832.1 uPF0297 protein Calow_0999 [Firmicutes bacterium CAG:582]